MRLILALLLVSSVPVGAAPQDFAILGDAGVWNDNAKSIQASILRTNVRQLVLPGDNLYNVKKSYAQIWDRWKEKGFQFPVVAIGNHGKGYVAEKNYFAVKDENYLYRAGPATIFLVVNSDNQYWEKSQVKWLDQELTKSNDKFIFIVYHHPSFDVVTQGHRWTDRKEFQTLIRPVLTKHRAKITAILNGHDHVAALLHVGDLPIVISGATQNPTKRGAINNSQFGSPVKTDFFGEPVPHWVRLSVDEDKNLAELTFIRAAGDAQVFKSCLRTGKPSTTCP